MSRRNLIRWTPKEMESVVADYAKLIDGSFNTNQLRLLYQGRSLRAIQFQADRIRGGFFHTRQAAASNTPSRRNPVYAAIEQRMVAAGLSPELIQSIISPRKVSIPANLFRGIENTLAAAKQPFGWWFFSVNASGLVSANYLNDNTTMSDIERNVLTNAEDRLGVVG